MIFITQSLAKMYFKDMKLQFWIALKKSFYSKFIFQNDSLQEKLRME